MPIVYALIARKKSVLAEYTAASGNFPTVTRVLLAKIPEQDGKMSYVYDKHIFHFIVDGGITFLCMADEQMKRRNTFAFLEDIKSIWRDRYSQIELTAIAFSLNEAFAPILREKIEFYSSDKSMSIISAGTSPSSSSSGGGAVNIARVQQQLDNVKEVMVENVDRLLQRGEKIELLVDKSERLNAQAKKFEKSSKTLKNSIFWRNVRNGAIAFLIISVIILFIVMLTCGFTFEQCRAH